MIEEEEEEKKPAGPSFVPTAVKQEVDLKYEEFLKVLEEEVVEEKKKKKDTIPEPSIKIGKVTPMGQIPLEFNQAFIVPEEGHDYS